MDETARRFKQLEADLYMAKALHTSSRPPTAGRHLDKRETSPKIPRDNIGSLLLGGASLLLALWGIMQANETAKLDLETARLSILPSLEFVIDSDKQTLSLHNYGNGPAAIYYVKLTHRDWTIEQHRSSKAPADLRSFFPVVLSNLYNDASFSPAITTSNMTRALDNDASLPLFSIDTAMTKAQKDKLFELPQQVKIEFCYTNMLGDSSFWAGLGTVETSPRCPRPPQQGEMGFVTE